MLRTVGRKLYGPVLISLLLLGVPSLAEASTIDVGPAKVHNCISGLGSSCPADASRGPLGGGTQVTMRCWALGDWSKGRYRSDKWFYVTVTSGKFHGKTGFVHSSWVKAAT